MRPDIIYLAVTGKTGKLGIDESAYTCIGNRSYRSACECVRTAEKYTKENDGSVAVVVSFTVETGLRIEASFAAGQTDALHTIGVANCEVVYSPCVLAPIVAYLDTICRANAEKEGRNG